jgi:hypothetical protein
MLKWILMLSLFGLVGTAAAHAAELTNAEAQLVLAGLTQLDGYDRVITERGQEKSVRELYHFDAALRLAIATDIAKLRPALQMAQEVHNALVQQYGVDGKVPADKVMAFNEEAKKLWGASSGVSLNHIKAGDLRLDSNPIPASVLSLLAPILDQQ